MQEDFIDISDELIEYFQNEKPKTVLEISGYNNSVTMLLSTDMKHLKPKHIDRIDLTDSGILDDCGIYGNIFNSDCLSAINDLKKYDAIIIFHLFENMHANDAKSMLIELFSKVNKSILVITPIYPYDLESNSGISSVREYHPVFFIGLDFSYYLHGEKQIYSFFPKTHYEKLLCDDLPQMMPDNKKMKIAYILPHHGLTGGVKAMLQQIKELSCRGHIINLYYRSNESKNAIPSWSHLAEDDVSAQIIIPMEAEYVDYLDDEDVIVLGFMNQLVEFKGVNTPIVLWEQGYPEIYGDYKKILYSNSNERQVMHMLYRTPVYLLAVSETIKDILKGIYNRESQFFPNGIDTEFYCPAESKNNNLPVVLLVGNPAPEFKGFKFAFKVLDEFAKKGIPFKVWWASQADVSINRAPYDIELFIQPTQEKLAELYRNADVFISTSLYESFPLPPFEAMASGTAVIATDCGGIYSYAEPGENCLICEQGDVGTMVFALSSLLLNPQAREALAKAGRETALKFSFNNIVPILETCLSRILASKEK